MMRRLLGSVEVTRPKLPEPSEPLGIWNAGVFVKLNASQRNWARQFSPQ